MASGNDQFFLIPNRWSSLHFDSFSAAKVCEGGVDVFSLGDLCADQEQLTVLTDPFWEVLSSNSHRERERASLPRNKGSQYAPLHTSLNKKIYLSRFHLISLIILVLYTAFVSCCIH